MKNYTVFADSTCDIGKDTLKSWGIDVIDITFTFDGDDRVYTNDDIAPDDFYTRMKNGVTAHTSAINCSVFRDKFENELKQGSDVLFISFSSGLSSSFCTGKYITDQLSSEYKDRQIVAVDSLCESAGYGLLLYLVSENCLKAGKSIDETVCYIESIKLKICHVFTVDDLKYLKRGGRISSATAFAGTLLGIKPILHMDENGKLVSVGKVRGRCAAIKELACRCAASALCNTAPIFISHGGCPDDAEKLKNILETEYRIKVMLTAEIGPVIGSHSGPGTLAIYYFDEKR